MDSERLEEEEWEERRLERRDEEEWRERRLHRLEERREEEEWRERRLEEWEEHEWEERRRRLEEISLEIRELNEHLELRELRRLEEEEEHERELRRRVLRWDRERLRRIELEHRERLFLEEEEHHRRRHEEDEFEKKMRQVYKDALKGGEVKVAYGRVTFLGPAAVGKTSLKRGLMNKPLPDVAQSTTVAAVHTVKPVSYEWARAGSFGETYWNEVNEGDEIEEMAQLMALIVQQGKNHSRLEKIFSTIKKPFMTTPAVAEFKPHSTPVRLAVVDKEQLKKIKSQEVQHMFQNLLRRASHITIPKIDPEVWLHVWDSGGQPVFLDVLPAFLTSRTMFLLLFNATKDLKNKWEVLETIRGSEEKTDEGELSTLDLLHQWMTAIYSHLARSDSNNQLVEYPRIMLVGTHGDMADETAVKQEIESHCAKKLYSDMLYLPPLVVDNTKAGKGECEDPGFRMIRARIHEMTCEKLSVKTPVKWVLFRKVLKKIDKKVMSLGEVCTVAVACYIDQQAVTAVLTFYHELGALLFYSHIRSLQNIVIVDPKWLVDQLGKLLTLERQATFDPTRTLWPLLSDKGIVLESLYKAVWKKCGIDPNALMDLLVHFLLAAPVPPTCQHGRSGTDRELFLPCVLKFYHGDPSTLLVNHQRQAAPLFITFEALGFVPPGFFIRLIASLATVPKGKSKEVMYQINFSQPVYRNCITFSCQDSKGVEVTLTELSHKFQINVIQNDPQDLQALQSVCGKLLLNLDQCYKTVHKLLYGLQTTMTIGRELRPAMEIRQKYALLCQSPKCHSPSSHYCDFIPGDKKLFCTKGAHQSLPSQMYWLTSEIPSTVATQPQSGDTRQEEISITIPTTTSTSTAPGLMAAVNTQPEDSLVPTTTSTSTAPGLMATVNTQPENSLVGSQPHLQTPKMNLHTAKCQALRKQSNILRIAILGDLDNIRFELCAKELIPTKVRDQKEATEMVSTIENRLAVDESVWKKLIEVLDNCNSMALVKKLSDQLREEMSSSQARQQATQQAEAVLRE